jgi:hypothetical protein
MYGVIVMIYSPMKLLSGSKHRPIGRNRPKRISVSGNLSERSSKGSLLSAIFVIAELKLAFGEDGCAEI